MKVGRGIGPYILANSKYTVFSDCLYWKEISPHAGGYFIRYTYRASSFLLCFSEIHIFQYLTRVGMTVKGIVSRDGFGF
jgi:hypothetical protein